MEFATFILAFLLLLNGSRGLGSNEAIKTELKVFNSGDETDILQFVTDRDGVDSELGEATDLYAADNGYGNPGDLIYRTGLLDVNVVNCAIGQIRDDSLQVIVEPEGEEGDNFVRYRESNDVLQIREVIVLPEISSDVQEIQWYAVTPARRITSVRVLNFGRERAYTLRIDVAGNEVQTILRIPSNYDPRIMIEVYGL